MPLLPMSSFFERISWGQRTLRRSTFWLFAAHIFPSTLWRIIPVSKAIWKGNDTTGSLGDETNHWTESWPSKGPKAFVTLPILPFLTEGLWNGPSFERILDTSFSIALKKWWKKRGCNVFLFGILLIHETSGSCIPYRLFWRCCEGTPTSQRKLEAGSLKISLIRSFTKTSFLHLTCHFGRKKTPDPKPETPREFSRFPVNCRVVFFSKWRWCRRLTTKV